MIDIIEDNPYLPVSIQEMRKFLRVEHNELDDLIITHIKLATRIIEHTIGKSFLTKTYRYRWKQIAPPIIHQTVRMPMGPVIEVVSIKNILNQTLIRRFITNHDYYIIIPEFLTDVEFIYKAGLAKHPSELGEEYQHLVRAVAQGLYEEQDLSTHYSARLLECYKSNSCASI